jgi:hypothetical protein
MGLQPEETSGGGQAAAETEVAERTVYEGTVVRPMFTPAAREADDTAPDDDMVPEDDEVPEDDTVPEDVNAQTGAVVESATPAEDYPGSGDSDEPVESLAAVEAEESAGHYTSAETGEATPEYDTPAAQETSAAATAEPITAAPAVGAPPAPAALADLDQPLLSEDAEVLARWQRVQLGFIDDPQAAVAGAADLVEEVVHTLVEALEQRQRQMRTMWDLSAVGGSAAQGDIKADTEQLRQMMQRYQALFRRLHQPV